MAPSILKVNNRKSSSHEIPLLLSISDFLFLCSLHPTVKGSWDQVRPMEDQLLPSSKLHPGQGPVTQGVDSSGYRLGGHSRIRPPHKRLNLLRSSQSCRLTYWLFLLGVCLEHSAMASAEAGALWSGPQCSSAHTPSPSFLFCLAPIQPRAIPSRPHGG